MMKNRMLWWDVFLVTTILMAAIASVYSNEMEFHPLDSMVVRAETSEDSCTALGGVVINSKCLKFSLDKMMWEEAKSACSSIGGELASLEGPTAQVIFDYYKDDSGEIYWVGASKIGGEGVWQWLNGQPMVQEEVFWQPGHPREPHKGVRNCVILYTPGYSGQCCTCNNQWNYICDLDKSITKTIATTTIKQTVTLAPTIKDKSITKTIATATIKQTATLAPTIKDSVTCPSVTCPSVTCPAVTCPSVTCPSVKIDPCHAAGGVYVGNQCLFLSTSKVTWYDAVDACKEKNGQLACPEDPQAVADFVGSRCIHKNGWYGWVGASDLTTKGDWEWVNGRALDHAEVRWSSGRPSHRNGFNCLITLNKKYYDDKCDSKRLFICDLGVFGYKTPNSSIVATKDPCYSAGGVRIRAQCLYFSAPNEKSVWEDAVDACASKNGQFASLVDPWEVGVYAQRHSWAGYVGASFIAAENKWQWMNGTAFDKAQLQWQHGQPNTKHNRYCVYLHKDYRYYAFSCSRNVNYRYICDLGI